MADTERLKQRLQAITQERRSQEKIESMTRELEVDRLLLRQMKRKSLRERWLLEGTINSSMDSQSHEHHEANNRISEAQKLQERINRRQLEIEHLELTGQHNTLLKHPEAYPEVGTQVLKGAQGEDAISGTDTVSPGAAESVSRALEVDESPAVIFTMNSERVQELPTNSEASSIQSKEKGGRCGYREQGDECRLDEVWNNGGCESHYMGSTRRKALDVECSNACLRLEQNPGRSGVENTPDLPGSCTNSARCQLGAGMVGDGSSLEEQRDGVHVEIVAGAGRMQDASSVHLDQDQVSKQQQIQTTPTLCGKTESLLTDPNINLDQSLNIHGAANLEAGSGMHNTMAVEDIPVGPCLEDKEPLGHLSTLGYSAVPEVGSREVFEGMIKAELVLIANEAGEASAVDHEVDNGPRTEWVEQEEEQGHGSGGEGKGLEEAPTCSPADGIDAREGDGVTEPRGGSEGPHEAGGRDSQLGKPKLHGLLVPEVRDTEPALSKVEEQSLDTGLEVGVDKGTEVTGGEGIVEGWVGTGVGAGLEDAAGTGRGEGVGKGFVADQGQGSGTDREGVVDTVFEEGVGTRREAGVDIERGEEVSIELGEGVGGWSGGSGQH
ncbi:paralemmin-3-like [Leucoraja erinacea]|uniref:paralemmin-3-like n=1 Tax=Leucoraja erinaceus TaxID=7782 RepID=UPI0024563E1E|nr:paralemmin-3-like [Leucoraja erinacea]